MKTIILVNTNKIWGGGEKWHLEAARFFSQYGYNIIFICEQNSVLYQKVKECGFKAKCIKVCNLSFLNPIKVYRMFRWFKSIKAVAIIFTLPSDIKLMAVAAKFAGIKKIIYRRGVTNKLKNTYLNKFLFKYVIDMIVANSQTVANSLCQTNAWFPLHKLYVIPNGITIPKIEEVQPLYKKRFEDEIVLGNASRLIESKNHDFLIYVVKELKNLNIRVKLLIAGEGPLKDNLKIKAHKLGVEENIEFLGLINDMGSFFKSLDFFVFPSLIEGHSNVLLEAMAHGVVVICSDIDANKEIIDDKKTGFLIPMTNASELSNLIKNLYEDKLTLNIIRKNAFKKLEEKFDYNVVFARWLDLIGGD